MKRTKLNDRALPDYTKGEEIFNMVSHIVGGAVGICALVLCVVFAALHRNVWGVVSCSIYGAAWMILYTMSSIYHGLSPRLKAKKSISGDRSLLDISSHRGNVHSDRALLAPLSESVGRMDRFRRNLGACRSRNHSQFDRPCDVQALLDDMLSRNGVDDRALREADIPCNRSMGMRISHRRRSILHRRLRALPSREEEPQKIHTFGIPSVRRFRKHNAHVHDSFLHSIKRHEI